LLTPFQSRDLLQPAIRFDWAVSGNDRRRSGRKGDPWTSDGRQMRQALGSDQEKTCVQQGDIRCLSERRYGGMEKKLN